MKQMEIETTKEKFFRNFDKKVLPDSFLSRFSLEEDAFRGKRKGNSFFFYRKKRKFFALFSCTLRGKVMKSDKTLRIRYGFTRPLLFGILILLWALLLLFVGGSLLFAEPDFALFFLLPGAFLLFPLFFFSKKERLALEKHLFSVVQNKE